MMKSFIDYFRELESLLRIDEEIDAGIIEAEEDWFFEGPLTADQAKEFIRNIP